MKRITCWLLLVSVGQFVGAQDLTHPTDMGLPESNFVRPDPSDYQTVLENGLTAYVARADQVPLVTLSAFIRVGTVDDDKQGAAESLLESLRHSGPANLSPDEFTATLKAMTADYVVEMHDEWTEISLNVPVEDLDLAMTLFAGVVRTPGISSENISKVALAVVPDANDLQGEDGPALYEGSLNATVDRFRDLIYAEHPYGSKPSGDDFDELSVADVTEFHATYFVPGNVVLSIAGDLDIDAMHQEVAKQFGSWSRQDVSKPPTIVPAVGSKTRQHSFPAEKLQSWLVFGHHLPLVPDRDQASLEVMNYILAGGHLWTRMTIETRYKYGYTNDASGFLTQKWFGPGTYDFRSYSRPEVIKPIYKNMLDQIFRIRDEEVSVEELFVAVGALTEGTFQIQYLDGYSAARNFALEYLRYRNHERSASYVDRIRAVTEKDVLAAARKYLRPDEMQIVLVGRPENLLN